LIGEIRIEKYKSARTLKNNQGNLVGFFTKQSDVEKP
jgi:hypothetical protein